MKWQCSRQICNRTCGNRTCGNRSCNKRCCNKRCCGKRCNGTSTLEVVIAFSLLVVAVTFVGRFVSQVRVGLKDRELSARTEWELRNARERIGSWPVEQITRERIEQLPLSKSLSDRFESAGFVAQVQHIDQPIVAEQVTLAIAGTRDGQKIEPAVVTFWVSAEEKQ